MKIYCFLFKYNYTIFVNLYFVYKNLYILKLIDNYFFTSVVFENMKRNKIKIKIRYYIYIYIYVIIIIDISFYYLYEFCKENYKEKIK